MHILSAQLNVGIFNQACDAFESCKRGTDGDGNVRIAADRGVYFAKQFNSLSGSVIHLPISRYQIPAMIVLHWMAEAGFLPVYFPNPVNAILHSRRKVPGPTDSQVIAFVER